MVRWHHRLNGCEFEQTLGDGEGQGSLVVHGVAKSWTRPSSGTTMSSSQHHAQSFSHVQLVSNSQSCDPMDCSPPGSSVHGISQTRILQWVAIPFSRESSQPRDGTHISCVSCIGRQILYHCATWEAQRSDSARLS